MRLIDADTLFREMEKAQWYNNADRDEIAEELVLNEPTIEERKKGKWIEQEDSRISGICSACGWESYLYETDVVGMPFCPNCGAKMEQEDRK